MSGHLHSVDVVVVGAGAIGTLLAHGFATAGRRVAVVDRGPRTAQIRRDGLRVRTRRHADVRAGGRLRRSRCSAASGVRLPRDEGAPPGGGGARAHPRIGARCVVRDGAERDSVVVLPRHRRRTRRAAVGERRSGRRARTGDRLASHRRLRRIPRGVDAPRRQRRARRRRSLSGRRARRSHARPHRGARGPAAMAPGFAAAWSTTSVRRYG